MSAGRPDLTPVEAVWGGRRQIHLVGFMGAGKSTVGRLLARRLLWNFLDLDALVERHAGLPVPEIFARDGESVFRDHEHHVLRQAVQKPRTVVALGGGTFTHERNRELSAAHAVSVWLDCPLDEIARRVEASARPRPLWDPEGAAALLARRAPDYGRANLRVDAGAAPEAVAEEILRRLAEA